MISEKQFVENYEFFWKSALPMTKFFLRKINLELTEMRDKFLDSGIYGRRRSFISQVGFIFFADSIKNKYELKLESIPNGKLNEVQDKCKLQFNNYSNDEVNITAELDQNELVEAIELGFRMKQFFSTYQGIDNIVISPKFNGCGFLDNCYGDVLIDDTLYEIKMVNRNYRANDCKQLMVYCALNYMSNQYAITNVALYNPRLGKHFKTEINQFCLMISGKSSSELFGEIIDFVSGGGISK